MEKETPVTSETGGTKNQKLARFDLVPPFPLRKLAEQYGRGAEKYGDRNWERGYQWSLSYAALQRHLNAFWSGEDYDPEFPDAHHLDAAMFHVMSLRYFAENFPEYDNRPLVNRRVPYPDTPGRDEALEALLKEATDEAFGTSGYHRAAAIKPPKQQRTQENGRVSEIQASRWEVP
jgi:hypothetical protein